MVDVARKWWRALAPAWMALGLVACGSGDGTVSGVAATGAPLAGATVVLQGANGQTVTVTADANGAYAAGVDGLTFPLMIRAQGGGTTLYSWAFDTGTSNITPFTTMALIANPVLSDALDAVYAGWASSAAGMTSTAMTAAQAVVNANLQLQLNGAGLDYTTYDFLRSTFVANGSGFDAALDALHFTFNLATGEFNISLNGTSTGVVFNFAISTTGITIGGSGGGSGGGGSGGGSGGGGTGGGSATVNFTGSTPSSGNGSMTVSSVTKTVDGALTRITVTGTVGGATAELRVYFNTGGGHITNVSYWWGANVQDNIVFTPSVIPNGEAVHNATTKTINLDTALSNADGIIVVTPTKLAHVSATIVYP